MADETPTGAPAPPPVTAAPDPHGGRGDSSTIRVGPDAIHVFGVTYAREFFVALADRLGAGTQVEVFRRNDGTWGLHHFKPQPPAPP